MIALALLLIPALTDCVPARWPFSDAASLERLNNSPVNCLIVDRTRWPPEADAAARARNLRVLDAAEVPLGMRAVMKFDAVLTGTSQAVWPGIRLEKEGAITAGPTASAWIDTNSGFLKFARALMKRESALWLGNLPPSGVVVTPRRYVQAIADAAMSGARWVVALDPELTGWARINETLRFYETNRRWWDCPDFSRLVVIQDTNSGALASGGILDMIVSKHIPVEVVTPPQLAVRQIALLLNLDPSLLDEAQKLKVREIARRGATLVNGPPDWKLEAPRDGGYLFGAEQVKQIGEMWREINGILGRRNFGVRLFNAATVLANLKSPDGGKTAALHLVNYSDYAVEDLTVQVQGPYRSARLLTPRGTLPVDVFHGDEGMEVTVKRLEDIGILLLE